MKKKKSVEDYLKTIYILSKNKDVHGADIARAIGVSRPTVCVSLKALEEEGYILMDDAREVHLTEKGIRIAEETYERHICVTECGYCSCNGFSGTGFLHRNKGSMP